MDLTTRYLGFDLPHPVMPGASPLVDDLDMVRRLEDAGAAAIVMHSLFEEQVRGERRRAHAHFAGAEPMVCPPPEDFALGPDEYLEQLQRIKQGVDVPVIASLNGTGGGGWLGFARLLEQAGADALELNLYQVAADAYESGAAVERRMQELLERLKDSVEIPVAVKLSPFHTSVAYLASRLDEAGADGLVLFNRFVQADIDPEELTVRRVLHLSDPSELLLRLSWLALLSGRVESALAVSGGVHTSLDVVKAILAGADVVQVVSAVLRHGPEVLRELVTGLERWLEAHGEPSLAAVRGRMRREGGEGLGEAERVDYIEILQSWRGSP